MNAIELIAIRAHSICASGLKDAEVPSPCISVCQMDVAASLCTGCWRTLDEIAAWSGMDAPAKIAVWALIAQRTSDGRR